MSTTTIRVEEETKEHLKDLKEERDLKSYEEVLRELLRKETEKVSMFGADPGLEKWKESDRVDFEDR